MKHLNLKIIAHSLCLTFTLFAFAFRLKAQEQKNESPQYLFPVFTKGVVLMKTGSKNVGELNYNTVAQEIVFMEDGKQLAVDKPETIDTVFLQDRKFVPFEKAFYEVLLKAAITLFIQHKSNAISAGNPAAYGGKSQVSAVTNISYLISSGIIYHLKLPDDITISSYSVNWIRKNNTMYKFTNERQFLKIFPEKESEIKLYIKKNDINIKKRDDLIQVVIYCNGLLK